MPQFLKLLVEGFHLGRRYESRRCLHGFGTVEAEVSVDFLQPVSCVRESLAVCRPCLLRNQLIGLDEIGLEHAATAKGQRRFVRLVADQVDGSSLHL